MREADSIRFWSKVNIKDKNSCWEWKVDSLRRGYGRFKSGGKWFAAHRISWNLTNGDIPKNMLVLHKCDNKLCCNPSHLYIGTSGDNAKDRSSRNLQSSAVYGKSCSKLHSGELWLIRKLKIITPTIVAKRYRFSAAYVSKMFRVSPGTILHIWNSEVWICKGGYYG